MMAVICLTNHIAIGCKKIWHWRKEKIAASQNQQLDIQIQEHPPQNNCLFNNSIYNPDLTSLKNLFLLFIVIFLLWMIHGISLSLIDKTESIQVAMRYFVTFRLSSIIFVVICPLVLLATKKEAKQHIKFLFWNELAPDFFQLSNPNRVQKIELDKVTKV